MEYVTKQMQTYKTGNIITDQFYIDDDYNVPDAKNDVKKVILGEGTLTVEDMKVVENYIRVSGKLNFKVLYVTEEGECYHYKIDCSGLKRTVYMINKSQIEGKGPCSRCGGN